MNKTTKSLDKKQPQNITAAILILAGVVLFALTDLLVTDKDKPLVKFACTLTSGNCSSDKGQISLLIAIILAIASALIVVGVRKYRHLTAVTSVIITVVLTAVFFYFVMAHSFAISSFDF